jgi:hypothetical protein
VIAATEQQLVVLVTAVAKILQNAAILLKPQTE